MPLFTIPENEWEKAKQYFKDKRDAVKMGGGKYSKDNKTSHSFIKVNNEIYAVANRKFNDEAKSGLLGQGVFGKVKVVQSQKGDNFAVKIEGRGLRKENDAELTIMKLLKFSKGQAERSISPRPYKGKQTVKKLYTILKLKEGEELAKKIYIGSSKINRVEGANALTEYQRYQIAYHCCEALQNLHANRIIHGDIKPENFMCKIDGSTILVEPIDFGFSMRLSRFNNTVTNSPRGTPFYMAPEITRPEDDYQRTFKAKFSAASDIYGLGKLFKEDLKLPPEVYEAMLNPDPKKRSSLNKMKKELSRLMNPMEDEFIKKMDPTVNNQSLSSQSTKRNQLNLPLLNQVQEAVYGKEWTKTKIELNKSKEYKTLIKEFNQYIKAIDKIEKNIKKKFPNESINIDFTQIKQGGKTSDIFTYALHANTLKDYVKKLKAFTRNDFKRLELKEFVNNTFHVIKGENYSFKVEQRKNELINAPRSQIKIGANRAIYQDIPSSIKSMLEQFLDKKSPINKMRSTELKSHIEKEVRPLLEKFNKALAKIPAGDNIQRKSLYDSAARLRRAIDISFEQTRAVLSQSNAKSNLRNISTAQHAVFDITRLMSPPKIDSKMVPTNTASELYETIHDLVKTKAGLSRLSDEKIAILFDKKVQTMTHNLEAKFKTINPVRHLERKQFVTNVTNLKQSIEKKFDNEIKKLENSGSLSRLHKLKIAKEKAVQPLQDWIVKIDSTMTPHKRHLIRAERVRNKENENVLTNFSYKKNQLSSNTKSSEITPPPSDRTSSSIRKKNK